VAAGSSSGFAFVSRGAPGRASESDPAHTAAAPPSSIGPPGLRHPPAAPPPPATDAAHLWAWEADPGPGLKDPFHDDWKHWPERGGGGGGGGSGDCGSGGGGGGGGGDGGRSPQRPPSRRSGAATGGDYGPGAQ
jgi:hypothetical protein